MKLLACISLLPMFILAQSDAPPRPIDSYTATDRELLVKLAPEIRLVLGLIESDKALRTPAVDVLADIKSTHPISHSSLSAFLSPIEIDDQLKKLLSQDDQYVILHWSKQMSKQKSKREDFLEVMFHFYGINQYLSADGAAILSQHRPTYYRGFFLLREAHKLYSARLSARTAAAAAAEAANTTTTDQ